MDSLREKAETELHDLEKSGLLKDMPATLRDYQNFLKGIRTDLKADAANEARHQIAKQLIHKIEVLPETIRIHFKAGRSALGRKSAYMLRH